MKHLWWRTLLAMVGGIALFALGFAVVVGTLERSPAWSDLLALASYVAFVTACFALPAWFISVLPLTLSSFSRRALTHRIWMECSWTIVGLLAFAIIMAIGREFPPPAMFLMPTLVGALAGLSMRAVLARNPLPRKEAA